ncbi:MAG: diadenylate cyclase CdaA [Bacteroidota bacterium]|nr:diadenylate cyclase CdaA [Bacteroidota bacterium]
MNSLFHIGFLEIKLIDIADVVIVSILIYQLYKLLRGSIALRIFIGLLSVYFFYLLVKAARMELLSTILGNVMGVGFIAVIILFQQEIRKFLLIAGKRAAENKFGLLDSLFFRSAALKDKLDVSPIVESAKILGGTNTGALIVIAKSSELRLYAETGDEMEALISKRLLLSIFNKTSPLHDGAVIIVGNRIKAARCILPVTENSDLPAFLGLRHRAAIGITELTDCIVVVVSEETGEVSLSRDGKLYYNLSSMELRNKLILYLFGTIDEIDKEIDASTDVIKETKKEGAMSGVFK